MSYNRGFASYCYDLALQQEEERKVATPQPRMRVVKASGSHGDIQQQMIVAGKDVIVHNHYGSETHYHVTLFGEGFGDALKRLLGGGERSSVRQLSQGQSREIEVRGR